MMQRMMKSATQKAGRRGFSTALKDKMQVKIAARQAEVKEFNKEFGSTKLGDVTVG